MCLFSDGSCPTDLCAVGDRVVGRYGAQSHDEGADALTQLLQLVTLITVQLRHRDTSYVTICTGTSPYVTICTGTYRGNGTYGGN